MSETTEARKAASQAPAGAAHACCARNHAEPGGHGGGAHVGHADRAASAGLDGSAAGTQWTCPMHPEIVRDAPGACPICGMALEPMGVAADEAPENEELRDMTRRFVVSAVLTLPLVTLAMAEMIPGVPHGGPLGGSATGWLGLLLATPVVLWGGWPFLVRG